MSKYKYYFRKPRTEIVKDVFYWLGVAGAVCIAATSPYFVNNLMRGHRNWKKYNSKKVSNTFYNLKRQGYLNIEEKNHQIYISLTEEGKKKAGWFQIDALKINKPEKWDGKWRIVIFDIVQPQNLKRNAFRGKIKELGFYPLQKSVWVYPYPCQDEISLLRDFFDLSQRDICLIVAENIENQKLLQKAFGLN